MKPKQDPPLRLLRALFYYEDGMLLCKTKRSQCKVGDRAGSLDRNSGYRIIGIGLERYQEHRLVWILHKGPIPAGFRVDHRNTIRDDNRIENLRLATDSQNKANSRKMRSNTSGYKGVSKCRGKWKAEIRVNYKSTYLGLHDTPEEAHKAYQKAARQYRGEFANHGACQTADMLRQIVNV